MNKARERTLATNRVDRSICGHVLLSTDIGVVYIALVYTFGQHLQHGIRYPATVAETLKIRSDGTIGLIPA